MALKLRIFLTIFCSLGISEMAQANEPQVTTNESERTTEDDCSLYNSLDFQAVYQFLSEISQKNGRRDSVTQQVKNFYDAIQGAETESIPNHLKLLSPQQRIIVAQIWAKDHPKSLLRHIGFFEIHNEDTRMQLLKMLFLNPDSQIGNHSVLDLVSSFQIEKAEHIRKLIIWITDFNPQSVLRNFKHFSDKIPEEDRLKIIQRMIELGIGNNIFNHLSEFKIIHDPLNQKLLGTLIGRFPHETIQRIDLFGEISRRQKMELAGSALKIAFSKNYGTKKRRQFMKWLGPLSREEKIEILELCSDCDLKILDKARREFGVSKKEFKSVIAKHSVNTTNEPDEEIVSTESPLQAILRPFDEWNFESVPNEELEKQRNIFWDQIKRLPDEKNPEKILKFLEAKIQSEDISENPELNELIHTSQSAMNALRSYFQMEVWRLKGGLDRAENLVKTQQKAVENEITDWILTQSSRSPLWSSSELYAKIFSLGSVENGFPLRMIYPLMAQDFENDFGHLKTKDTGRSGSALNSFSYSLGILLHPEPSHESIEKLEQFVQELKNPLIVPYRLNSLTSESHRSAAARAPLTYLALFSRSSPQLRETYRDHLANSVLQWLHFAPDLVGQIPIPTGHNGNDNLAPYYFYPSAPFVARSIRELQKSSKTTDEKNFWEQKKLDLLKLMSFLWISEKNEFLPLDTNLYTHAYFYAPILGALTFLYLLNPSSE